MKKEKFTWQNLKDVVNTLNEEQLKNEVIWWGDERGGKIVYVEILNDDYVDDGDCGVMPLKDWNSEIDGSAEIKIKKNTPILCSEY